MKELNEMNDVFGNDRLSIYEKRLKKIKTDLFYGNFFKQKREITDFSLKIYNNDLNMINIVIEEREKRSKIYQQIKSGMDTLASGVQSLIESPIHALANLHISYPCLFDVEKLSSEPQLLPENEVNITRIFKLSSTQCAVCKEDNTIKLWDFDTMSCVKSLVGHQSNVQQVQKLNPNELVSGSFDGVVKVWNLEEGIFKQTFQVHE